ncbi:unnamed protein product [Heligmosomoides polygyrus]|uniref:GOLD domain-containing protein n=1 Tax=Heligmosomoides polygyrus TaxID=6339 RepID=A0A183FGE1_HELPZ|nr:unnamed protein product [Heligmosomoides polygyrus]
MRHLEFDRMNVTRMVVGLHRKQAAEGCTAPRRRRTNPEIAPASLWNRKDIVEFKNTIKKEGSEGIIKVGHGETVTVRVPTHEDGTCLFWEFATDYYDIGFGVYFEWTIADSNQVSIHVSESDDEDEYDEAAVEGVEAGAPPVPGSECGPIPREAWYLK